MLAEKKRVGWLGLFGQRQDQNDMETTTALSII